MERITLGQGNTEIEIWPLGARLNAVRWRDFGDLVAGTETREQALGPNLNHGTLVGPVANRIAGGRCDIDGVPYQFELNENGRTFLHSGQASTRGKDWSVEELAKTSVTLTLELPHLCDDFPGNRTISATYSVEPDGFVLRVEARTDAPTLVNFALHTYWTLDGHGRAGQQLGIQADTYLPIDADTIPTGEVAPVEGTLFDLRTPRVPDTSIDHNFCLSDPGPDSAGVRVLADRGIGMDIETNAPGVQIFTGKEIGIAIEPQHWPDAPNHPNFPSILFRPGDVYVQSSRYKFFDA